MLNGIESLFIGVCLEWFLCGLYSGIFAIYLQCPKKESRSAMIIFYVLCLLYVLSTATVVSDLIFIILDDALSFQVEIDMVLKIFRIQFVQITLSGCCDVIAQFILIYRCWIVWGKDIRVVIIPSFLAITFIATWLSTDGAPKLIQLPGNIEIFSPAWSDTLALTALAATMAVNTLVTGLIIFKILKVFLEVKTTSVERTQGSLSSAAGSSNLQHIIFIIIESGMALFVIHLFRIVFTSLLAPSHSRSSSGIDLAYTLVVSLHQMLNGIAPTIIFVRSAMGLSFDDEESFKEGVESLRFHNPPSDLDTPALGSSGSMPHQERNEDICFNNSPSDDPNSLQVRRVGSCSSNTPQDSERIEVI